MRTRNAILGALVGMGATCLAAVAIAADSNIPLIHDDQTGASTPQDVAATSPEVAKAFPAFVGVEDSSTQQRLRDLLGATGPAENGPVGQADFSAATPSTVKG